MKIVLLHYSAPPVVGGVESVMASHARLLVASGHQVTILVGRGEAFDPLIPVHVHPLLDSRNAEVLAVKAELDQGRCTESFLLLRDRIQVELVGEVAGADILIAHNVASLNKNLALTAALNSFYTQPGFPRLILWRHDLACSTQRYRGELHDGYPWQLLCQEWPGATEVVVSETRRRELTNLIHIPESQIKLVPNGVDLYSFYKLSPRTIELVEKLNLLEADPLFLLPARLTPRKNIELALKILGALRQQMTNARLLITGPEGPHNPANAAYRMKLDQIRDKLGLQKAAHFLAEITTGFLPDEVISDFYKLADALLFPSLEEGFGIPLIEAGVSNIPVFCADIPVLRELGGDDVSYIDPKGDPGSIASQIHARLQSEMTNRWSRRARHGYTWSSIDRLYLEPLIQGKEKL
jgi:mannosylglucosylglycerate synthase